MPLTWALALQEDDLPAFSVRGTGEVRARSVRARDLYDRQHRDAMARKPRSPGPSAVEGPLSAETAGIRAAWIAQQLGDRGISLTNHSPRFYGMLFG